MTKCQYCDKKLKVSYHKSLQVLASEYKLPGKYFEVKPKFKRLLCEKCNYYTEVEY